MKTNYLKSAAHNALVALGILLLTGAAAIIPHLIPELSEHPNAFQGSFLIGLFGLFFAAYVLHRAIDCVATYYAERERQRRIKARWTEQRL